MPLPRSFRDLILAARRRFAAVWAWGNTKSVWEYLLGKPAPRTGGGRAFPTGALESRAA